MPVLGDFGGTVQRAFNAGGAMLSPGDPISAETAAKWPLPNRKALADSRMVEWHQAPAKAAQSVNTSKRST